MTIIPIHLTNTEGQLKFRTEVNIASEVNYFRNNSENPRGNFIFVCFLVYQFGECFSFIK